MFVMMESVLIISDQFYKWAEKEFPYLKQILEAGLIFIVKPWPGGVLLVGTNAKFEVKHVTNAFSITETFAFDGTDVVTS